MRGRPEAAVSSPGAPRPYGGAPSGARLAVDEMWAAILRGELEGVGARDWRPGIRQAARAARREALAPEQFVILVKDGFRLAARGRRAPARGVASELVNRVVTLAIEEFFSPDAPRSM